MSNELSGSDAVEASRGGKMGRSRSGRARIRRMVVANEPLQETGSTPALGSDLPETFSDAWQQAVRKYLHGAMRLCKAGSTGLSLPMVDADAPAGSLRWQATTGALGDCEGTRMPRADSPCGVCLEIRLPVILPEPEREFPYLKGTSPRIDEIMIVPLYGAGKIPLGTLWFAHHDAGSHFSDADCTVAQQFAMPLVRMIKTLAQLDSQAQALRTAVSDLAQERGRRELAEAAEHESRRMLGFKDTEIREVHHRVKNTIQMAATMLHLQARATSSIQVGTALREGHDRLQSLAAVHELLQRDPGDIHAIAMPRLLGVVIDTLTRSFAASPTQVRVSVSVDPIVLSADRAVLLALLVNEVVTNAYKHAFASRTQGELAIALREQPEHGFMLQITDDGVGMDSSRVRPGLGLELMDGFATQLGGSFAFSTPAGGTGTTVTLMIQGLAPPLGGESLEPSSRSDSSLTTR